MRPVGLPPLRPQRTPEVITTVAQISLLVNAFSNAPPLQMLRKPTELGQRSRSRMEGGKAAPSQETKNLENIPIPNDLEPVVVAQDEIGELTRPQMRERGSLLQQQIEEDQ